MIVCYYYVVMKTMNVDVYELVIMMIDFILELIHF